MGVYSNCCVLRCGPGLLGCFFVGWLVLGWVCGLAAWWVGWLVGPAVLVGLFSFSFWSRGPPIGGDMGAA